MTGEQPVAFSRWLHFPLKLATHSNAPGGTKLLSSYNVHDDRSRRRRIWALIGLLSSIFLCASLTFTTLLETRARWLLQPTWARSEREQELGILDPSLFRRALYQMPDREIRFDVVEPTAPHTHSVVLIHGLWDVAPHVNHVRDGGWAAAHPGIKWYLPKSTGVAKDDTGPPGWYNPWIANQPDWAIWNQVSDDLFNFSHPDVDILAAGQKFGDDRAYSSPKFWEDEHGLIRSARRLWHFMNVEVVGKGEGRVSWDKVIISGFSQGGFMTLVLATTMPVLAAGYQVYSGYLPLRTHPHRLGFNPMATISWVQGDKDELFHPPLVAYSIQVLKDLGYKDVTFSWDYGVTHSFGPYQEQTASMDRLISRVFGSDV